MKIQITGKHTDTSESFDRYMQETVKSAMQKYFEDPVAAHITIEKKGHQFYTEITSHVCHGLDVMARGHDPDPYTSFDMAVSRIKSKLSRHKTRMKDHRNRAPNIRIETVQKYILDGIEKEEQEKHPSIISEVRIDIPTLSVGDAVMQMDLKDLPVVFFRSPVNNQMNLVFRRADGNIGWVDLQSIETS